MLDSIVVIIANMLRIAEISAKYKAFTTYLV